MMMTHRQTSLVTTVWLLVTAGCSQELLNEAEATQAALISPNGVQLNGISLNRITLNRIGANRIMPNRIGANRIGANRIGSNRLAENALSERRLGIDDDVANGLLATPEDRELFSYMASCAFEDKVVLEAEIDGEHYEFPGGLGLAPAWEHRALSPHERRWLSACLIARVNAYGVSVSISLRGPHPALTPTAAEEEAYTLEEGAFYGDIFKPENEPIEWTACRGAAQAAGEEGDLVDRDCTEPSEHGKTVCGFAFAGDCLDYGAEAYACRREEHGYYANCHTVAGHGRWPLGTLRTEVITVFVRP